MIGWPDLSELHGVEGDDPEPQIPDAPEPNYRNPPSFPNGRPWVVDEDAWTRYEAAGCPEDWSE